MFSVTTMCWVKAAFRINDLRSYPGISTIGYAVIRAGSGIIARNIAGGGWTSAYNGKIVLRNRRSTEGDSCYTGNYGACDNVDEGIDNQSDASGYLCHAQPGAGKIINGKFTSEPIYAWGNTAMNICVGGTRAGLQCSTFDENATTGCPGSTCKDTSSFKPNEFVVFGGGLSDTQMQANRDFMNNTQHPNWQPYTCPHPLADPEKKGYCNPSVAGTAGYITVNYLIPSTAPVFSGVVCKGCK